MEPHRKVRQQLVRICHLLATKDYVSAMDGNVTARLSKSAYLATPTKVHKAFIEEDDLIVVDAEGRKVDGPSHREPTSEIFMHLAVYARRPDAQAVVHAHPPTAIAFTLAGQTLARCILPEVVLTLGQIPTAAYRTTGSRELASLVGELMGAYDALLLERHGAITLGADLIDAFGKMEKVEHTALITLRAKALGTVRELERSEVERLRSMGVKYSSRGQAPPSCEGCGACSSGHRGHEARSFLEGSQRTSSNEERSSFRATSPVSSSEGLSRIVTEEVLRFLNQEGSLPG